MEVTLRPNFGIQCRQYCFCFTCEDCVHFDLEEEVCAHGFPSEMHRRATYDAERKPRSVLFCKEFDLA